MLSTIKLLTFISCAAVAAADQWKTVTPVGDFLPRSDFGVSYDDTGNSKVYLFGGSYENSSSGTTVYYNDLWTFLIPGAMPTFTLVTVDSSSIMPSRRVGCAVAHSTTAPRYTAIVGGLTPEVIGGIETLVPAQDVFLVYDSLFQNYTDYSAGGPSPRAGAVATALDGNKIYVFGGVEASNTSSAKALNDLWVFDLLSMTWEGLGNQPVPTRYAAKGAILDGQWYIFGGFTLDASNNPVSLTTTETYSTIAGWSNSTAATGGPDQQNGGYAAGGAFYAHLFGGVATNGTPGCPDPSPTNANWLYEVSTSEFSPQEAGPVAVTGLQSFPFGVPIYSVGGYAENCTTVGNTTVVQNVYMTDIFVFTPVVTLPPSPSPPPSTTTTTGTSGALASFRRLGASALVVLAWSALM